MNKTNLIHKKTITIIGSSASGIAVFIQLIDLIINNKIHNKIKINIIDKYTIPTGGLAYETSYHCNLLNIPATGMSIVHNDKNHFYKWLLHNQHYIKELFNIDHLDPGNHFPRKLYGTYLKESFHTALTLARKVGIEVHTVVDEVIQSFKIQQGYKLLFKNNSCLLTDYFILCIGGFESHISQEFLHTDSYYSSPYSTNQPISTIPKNADVMIVGTRLSAIDSILMLKTNSHKGKIICISRHGQLPRVQGRYDDEQKPTILNEKMLDKLTHHGKTHLKLNQLLGLIRCEAELQENIILDCKKILNAYKNQRGLLKREIKLSDAIRPWQAALFKVNKLANLAWLKLSESDQDIVYKKYLGHFLTYRSAMPLKTALKLYSYLKNKELFIFQNKLDITYNEKNKLYTAKVKNNIEEVKAPYLINATGISSNIAESYSPLIQTLLQNRLIKPNRFGGCNVDPLTLNVIDHNNKINNSIYAMGAITQGDHIATSLLEHLVDCSQVIAHSVLRNINQVTYSHG
jgi:uncharacterized NAD(P)/FAD-binding protein YdhS